MALTTASNSGGDILRPEIVGPLIVQPVIAESVAAQVSTVVQTASHDYRLPIVQADPTAAWVAESAEITPTDADLGAVVATPAKVAALSVISRELADDSSPEAADVIGQGLARDIARKIDLAFFTAVGGVAPVGLTGATSAQDVTYDATDLDVFAEAISLAETVGARTTAFVTNPTVALALSQLKEATGSIKPLLSTDSAAAGTAPGARTVLGVPLYVAPDVATNTVWAIPKDRVYVVIRNDTRVEVDRSRFFTSDQVAIRATMRVAFALPHQEAIVRIAPAA
ncbi:MAG: phage major capsid protein [Candidatus Sericytochromatia bacterium]